MNKEGRLCANIALFLTVGTALIIESVLFYSFPIVSHRIPVTRVLMAGTARMVVAVLPITLVSLAIINIRHFSFSSLWWSVTLFWFFSLLPVLTMTMTGIGWITLLYTPAAVMLTAGAIKASKEIRTL